MMVGKVPSGAKRDLKKGFGLLEVIAGLGIATVVITALVSLSIFTLRSSLRSKLLLEGTKIANRELELVRAYRDASAGGVRTWEEFSTAVGLCSPPDSSCYMTLDGSGPIVGSFTESEGTPEAITRSFTAESLEDGDVIRISVEILWKDGASNRYSHLYTDLTNWQQR
jgi:hypothetical protein